MSPCHAPPDTLHARAGQMLHTALQALEHPARFRQSLALLIQELQACQHALTSEGAVLLAHPGRSADAPVQDESRFQTLVENLPLGVAVMDCQHRIQYTNPAFTQLFRVDSRHFDGKLCYEQYEHRTTPCAHCAGDRGLCDGRLHATQSQGIRADGSIFDVQIHAFPLRDAQGRAEGFIEIVEDISQRIQLENERRASEEQVRLIMANTHIGLALCDTQGHWREVNPSMCDMLGYTREELLASDIQAITHPADQAQSRADLQALVEGRRSRTQMEKRYLRKDGQVVWTRRTASAVHGAHGQVQSLIVEIEDIQAQKEAEARIRALHAELERQNQRLEAEVDKRTAQLYRSNRDLQSTLNAMDGVGIGIHWVDCETGRVLRVNQRAAQLLGYTPEEMLKLQVPDIDLHVTPERFAQLRTEVAARGFVHFESEQRSRDGRAVPVQASIYLQPEDPYGPARMIGFFTDISTRRQNEQELARYREHLEHLVAQRTAELQDSTRQLEMATQAAHLGIWMYDPRGHTLRWDARVYDIFGIAPQDRAEPLSYAFWYERIHPEDRHVIESKAQAFREGLDMAEVSYRILLPDGRIRHIESATYVERDSAGQMTRMVGINRDITDQKEAEAELRQAVEAAQSASVAKSQFLATMSHELRTPMNGVLGMAQMLMLPGVTDERRQEYARTILSSGQSLLTLLNDILDLSKIEAGRITLEAIAISPRRLLDEIGALFIVAARHKGLQLRLDWQGPGGAAYLGDPHRLRQILVNLVGNAIKFTERGRITVTGREQARSDGGANVRFEVIDTGIGISESARERLFLPFSQADSSITRQYGGTGLGLSIVRRLAQAMGGDAGVDSTPGQGSCFWVEVQLQLGSPQTESAPASAPWTDTRLRGRVLVVEDEPSNQKVITAYLHRIGVDCTLAANGHEALRALADGDPPDLVLMDLHMPGMDGFETSARIRAWEREHDRPPHPILALTADVQDGLLAHCRDAGMDGLLNKPILFEPLQQTLQHWLPAIQTARPEEPTRRVDASRIGQMLTELLPLLEGHKFAALRSMQALIAATEGSSLALDMVAARHELEQMDFDAAAQRLRRVALQQKWTK